MAILIPEHTEHIRIIEREKKTYANFRLLMTNYAWRSFKMYVFCVKHHVNYYLSRLLSKMKLAKYWQNVRADRSILTEFTKILKIYGAINYMEHFQIM